jgi:hypothetical protein
MLHDIRLERLGRYKHLSLLGPLVTYEKNEVSWIRPLVYKIYIPFQWCPLYCMLIQDTCCSIERVNIIFVCTRSVDSSRGWRQEFKLSSCDLVRFRFSFVVLMVQTMHGWDRNHAHYRSWKLSYLFLKLRCPYRELSYHIFTIFSGQGEKLWQYQVDTIRYNSIQTTNGTFLRYLKIILLHVSVLSLYLIFVLKMISNQ